MARDKDRLLLALYARPKYPDTYHYALMTCPKSHKRKFAVEGSNLSVFRKYHVKNTIQSVEGQLVQPWIYESLMVDRASEPGLLVFVVIGKIIKPDQLEKALENVPIYQADSEKGLSFDCVEWVRSAVESLRSAGIISKTAEWSKLKEQAIDFVAEKKNEGYWNAKRGGSWNVDVPELNLVKTFAVANPT
jgi:hypothetical protein